MDQLRLGPHREWYIPRLTLFGALDWNTIDSNRLLVEDFAQPPTTTGFEAGARFHLGDPNVVSFRATATYGDNDFLHNAVTGRPKGMYGDLGVSILF